MYVSIFIRIAVCGLSLSLSGRHSGLFRFVLVLRSCVRFRTGLSKVEALPSPKSGFGEPSRFTKSGVTFRLKNSAFFVVVSIPVSVKSYLHKCSLPPRPLHMFAGIVFVQPSYARYFMISSSPSAAPPSCLAQRWALRLGFGTLALHASFPLLASPQSYRSKPSFLRTPWHGSCVDALHTHTHIFRNWLDEIAMVAHPKSYFATSHMK